MAHAHISRTLAPQPGLNQRLIAYLNGPGHQVALLLLMLATAAHWTEHILQAIEIFVLGWPVSDANGALGLIWPWLVKSEWLHYIFALITLVGIVVLRPAFTGEGRTWWTIALAIQIWHHFEHLLLLGQALTGHYLFGATVPTSIIQLIIPRVELHLFYNALVTGPMVMAVLAHRRPVRRWSERPTCTCCRVLSPSPG